MTGFTKDSNKQPSNHPKMATRRKDKSSEEDWLKELTEECKKLNELTQETLKSSIHLCNVSHELVFWHLGIKRDPYTYEKAKEKYLQEAQSAPAPRQRK